MDRKQYFEMKLDMDSQLLRERTLPKLQAMMASSNMGFRRDADTNGFFLSRELTALEKTAIEYMPPEFTARKLWTVENLGAGLKSVNYAEILRSGKAKFLSDGETEVPNASATRSETPSPVRKGKILYSITLEEMEAMARSGVPLDSQKALAAKEGVEALLNDSVWFGDKARGIKGFFSWAKDGMLNVITPASVGVGSTNTWSTKTAEQIWDDLVNLAVASENATNDTIRSNVLAVSGSNYNLLMYKKFTDTTGQTLMARIKETGMFDRIERCPELKSVTHAGLVSNKGVAIAFSDRPDCFKIHHPLEFTTLPLEVEGFEHKVYCHADTAGLLQYRKHAGSYLLDV